VSGSSDDVRRLLEPIVGGVVTETRVSAGSWLDLEIGGTLIWINMTAWLLESATDFLLACEDRTERIAEVIAGLAGRRLTGVTVTPFLDLTLHFDDLRLVTFTVQAHGDSHHWLAELTTGHTLFAGPGQTWSLVRTGA